PTTTSPVLTPDQYLEGLLDAAVDDRLLLGVLEVGLDTVLLAETGLLGAAKGELVVGDHDRVDPRVACLELHHGPVRGGHVGGPDRRAEPERGIVREPERLVEVFH